MKNILLLLAGGFEFYEASVFIDVFGWNLSEGDRSTRLFSCGIKKDIRSSFDQEFIADYSIDEINPDDFIALAVPGGFEEYNFYADAYDERFIKLIRDFHLKNKIIASICVGALPVAKSGILAGKRGTTYAGKRQYQLQEFGVNVINEPVVFDDNIITSWNPSTAIDVAFLLLEYLTSKENSLNVKTIMGFN
jgi:4-methyl-5(b-hydroxyethyl)-thiazole monophosphate biosynthesis